jgi:hypothetical protein
MPGLGNARGTDLESDLAILDGVCRHGVGLRGEERGLDFTPLRHGKSSCSSSASMNLDLTRQTSGGLRFANPPFSVEPAVNRRRRLGDT